MQIRKTMVKYARRWQICITRCSKCSKICSLPYWSTTLPKTSADSIGDKHEELTGFRNQSCCQFFSILLLIVVIFISIQISMNAPITHVRTVAPASTEWMSSRVAVNRDSLGPSVKQVSVYEMAWLFRNIRHLVFIVPSVILCWKNLQLLGICASLTPSLPSLVDSCLNFYRIFYPHSPCAKVNKTSDTPN